MEVHRRIWYILAARERLVTSVCIGAGAMLVVPAGMPMYTRAIIAWDAGVLAYLGMIMQLFITTPRDRISHRARRQQEGEWTIFAITVAATAFSMVAIIKEFAYARSLPAREGDAHVALVAVTLLLSWLMTHTTFALRYAHEYYEVSHGRTDVDGGLEFPGEHLPDYLDFLYFALVLGMTFQVSDVQISSGKLRRLATLQGFLGFVFNTVILALTVNIAAGLL